MDVLQIPSDVKFYDHRGKHVALLAPGSAERDVAEKIAEAREAGITMREISEETGLSLSTLRRSMNRLLLTQSVEAGERDKEIRCLTREQAREARSRAKETRTEAAIIRAGSRAQRAAR